MKLSIPLSGKKLVAKFCCLTICGGGAVCCWGVSPGWILPGCTPRKMPCCCPIAAWGGEGTAAPINLCCCCGNMWGGLGTIPAWGTMPWDGWWCCGIIIWFDPCGGCCRFWMLWSWLPIPPCRALNCCCCCCFWSSFFSCSKRSCINKGSSLASSELSTLSRSSAVEWCPASGNPSGLSLRFGCGAVGGKD